jgi:predicted transcriptional regulator
MKPTVVLSVRIEPALRKRIERLATKYSIGRPETARVTVEALTIGLAELEKRDQPSLPHVEPSPAAKRRR